jgi:hypothetical protein
MPLADSANSYLTGTLLVAAKLHCTRAGLATGVHLVREGRSRVWQLPLKKEARFTDSWPQLRMLAGLYRPDLDPAGVYRQSRLPGRPGGPPGTQAVQRSSRQPELTASLLVPVPVSASGSGHGLVDHDDSDVYEWHGDMRAGLLF